MSNTGPATEWVKSSYSGGEGGQCLEWAPSVAVADGLVPVRDSKAPELGALLVSVEQWQSFVHHVSDSAG
ncbi:DUF397 domain-containing protein [Streptomyces afghaniensis]|uniref:DUF397 domain-containing protein n=1 Tax=Streptomyces afghaniensis TaxID=66865 RepID=UPI002781E238|nr:DUF397 domain-containing protein [Streptomyces afghaniensis]MDQ1016730.1 hypothetical protein [Streptomyces afghaniensis]